jgi:hypothetical protein
VSLYVPAPQAVHALALIPWNPALHWHVVLGSDKIEFEGQHEAAEVLFSIENFPLGHSSHGVITSNSSKFNLVCGVGATMKMYLPLFLQECA